MTSDRYVTVEGARLRYRDEGAGPAVILVHGWTLDLEMWDPQVAALGDTFRLVRFDRRGFGLSGGYPSGEQDATDIAALCGDLGLERVALLGMSQGARAVLRFASVAPERVWAVILDGPPSVGRAAIEDDLPIAHFQYLVRAQGLVAFRREWSAHPLMQLRTVDPEMQRLVSAMIQRYPGHDLAGSGNPGRSDAPLSLSSAVAPTLLLNGAHDLASRLRAAEILRTQLPHAEHTVIAGAGHLTNLDQPVAYNALCRSFLTNHSSEGARGSMKS